MTAASACGIFTAVHKKCSADKRCFGQKEKNGNGERVGVPVGEGQKKFVHQTRKRRERTKTKTKTTTKKRKRKKSANESLAASEQRVLSRRNDDSGASRISDYLEILTLRYLKKNICIPKCGEKVHVLFY